MTTIAWDGLTLAADSQSTSGDVICSLKEKKIYQPKDDSKWLVDGESVMALGCSGDCGAEVELQELLIAGLKYSTPFTSSVSFTALAVISKDRAFIISKEKGEDRASMSLQLDHYAIGSGGVIARTAMHCGKAAADAVQAAIEMDVYSGGSIDRFEINSR